MSIFIIVFFFVTIKGAFFQLLAYFPFSRQLRFPVWTVTATVGISQLVYSAVYTNRVINGLSTHALDLLFAGIGLALCFLQICSDRWKILFLSIFALDYGVAVQGVSLFLSCALLKDAPLEALLMCAADLTLKFQLLSAPFLLLLLKRTQKRIFQIQAPHVWRTIWILPAFMTLIVVMYTNYTSAGQVLQIRYLFSRLVLIFSMLFVYLVLQKALDMISRDTTLRQQSSRQNSLLALEQRHYRQLTAQIQETRQARHDLKQHIRVIRSYLKSGSLEALQDYVNRYAQTLPEDSVQVYCQNYAVNAIVNYYGMEAGKAGIDFYPELSMPDRVSIGEPDLCCVLCNLLENALLACQEFQEEETPYIRVIGKAEADRLLLSVENTCKRSPSLSKDGQFLSGKHPGYGTGTSSVRAIAARYQGSAEFHCENHVFAAYVLLYAQAKQPYACDLS